MTVLQTFRDWRLARRYRKLAKKNMAKKDWLDKITPKTLAWMRKSGALILIILSISSCEPQPAMASESFTTEASYYTVASCLREGTSGIMANGRRLNDDKLTAASWDFKFGTILRITNITNKKVILAVVTDRGPNKRLYRKGRKIDLSKMAFSQLAELKKGIIVVKVEVVR